MTFLTRARLTARVTACMISIPTVGVAIMLFAPLFPLSGHATPLETAVLETRIPSGSILAAIHDPAPGVAEELLIQGVMVVRDMGRYLLAVTSPGDAARLAAAGHQVEILGEAGPEPSWYTVTPGDATRLREAGARILLSDGYDAVVAVSPAGAAALAARGFEIARVFIRPIRARAATGAAAVAPPQVARDADPTIQAMVDAVSADSLSARIQRLQNFRTRQADTDSCQAAANWIKARFEAFGIDSVYFHHWSSTYKDNVVAVIPGVADPSKIVLIGAHYDSYTGVPSNAPGADDDGSGTAGILECARVLAGHPFDYTLVFVAFSGEELGLLGSEAYAVQAAARGDDIMGMVAIDMIGYVQPGDAIDLDIVRNTGSTWMRDLCVTSAATYVPGFTVVNGSLPGGASSDHASFWAQGYDAILFFEDTGAYSPYIHTSSDVVGTSYNSPALAVGSVRAAVALLATLAEPFTIAIQHTPLADRPESTESCPVTARIMAVAPLVSDSLLLHYSSPWGSGTAPLVTTGMPDEYQGFIPSVPGGTWVNYWLQAGDTAGHRRTDPPGGPGTTHEFFVGEVISMYETDFEGAPGWVAGAPGDDATSGIWILADPVGSWAGGTMVQTEDDHTAAPGTKCWVTGNGTVGGAQGDADVDGGRTTLLSPVFDLSSQQRARVRYDRWYTNDTGVNPAEDTWAVDVSADGGVNWVSMESTSASDRSWRRVEIDIDDCIPLTSTVRFRFIAEDLFPGSIVEAAIDDFAILRFQPLATSIAAASGAGGALPGTILTARAAPNPLRDAANFVFQLGTGPSPVSLVIFDVNGRRVRTVFETSHAPGQGVVRWDGCDESGARVPAGVYFWRLTTAVSSLSRKLVVAP